MSPVVLQPLWFLPFPSFPALPRLCKNLGMSLATSLPSQPKEKVFEQPQTPRFAKSRLPCLATARGFGVFPTFQVFVNSFEASAATGQIAFLFISVKCAAVLPGPGEP